MAGEIGLTQLPKSKSKSRALGWLTIRRSRSKNKYNLQTAEPHAFQHPDDRCGALDDDLDEDDIPKLVERLHVLESEASHYDPRVVMTTQRHLIDALRRENGALRLLRHQVDLLRRENSILKADLERSLTKKSTNGSKTKNGISNGEKATVNGVLNDIEKESSCSTGSSENITALKMENEKLRKSNDQLQNCLNEHKKQKVTSNGLTNGTTNGHELTNGTSDEEDSQNGGPSPRNAGAGEDKKLRPLLRSGNDNGAGTSGTSLVTVNCLRKSDGNFHDCDEILEERLKSHMAAKGVDLVLKEWSPGRDHHMVTLVFCLATNNVAKNITGAMEGVSTDAEVVLVVFHTASQDANRKDPETESLSLPVLSNACLVVDVFFSKRDSLYRCTQNNRAMSRLLHLFEMIC